MTILAVIMWIIGTLYFVIGKQILNENPSLRDFINYSWITSRKYLSVTQSQSASNIINILSIRFISLGKKLASISVLAIIFLALSFHFFASLQHIIETYLNVPFFILMMLSILLTGVGFCYQWVLQHKRSFKFFWTEKLFWIYLTVTSSILAAIFFFDIQTLVIAPSKWPVTPITGFHILNFISTTAIITLTVGLACYILYWIIGGIVSVLSFIPIYFVIKGSFLLNKVMDRKYLGLTIGFFYILSNIYLMLASK